MTTLASPWMLVWILPLTVLVVREFRNPGPSLQWSSLRFLKQLSPSLRAQTHRVPLVLIALSAALAIVALARPQRVETRVSRNIDGIDIMLVLDVSDSMLIEDMTPNRLEAAKQILQDFVKKRNSDRMGLVIFSGESYTRVPLTLDYQVLIDSISNIEISRSIKMGTAIGVALANGVARLRDSKAKSRVMVFLTDGENNSGTIDPETALQIAKDEGVRIYAIGIGKDGEAQLPIDTVDIFGRKVRRYQKMLSKVNDELLGKMASQTGGKYFRSTDNNSLIQIFEDIDRLERSKIQVNKYSRYHELYGHWLLAAVLLLASAMILDRTVWRRAVV